MDTKVILGATIAGAAGYFGAKMGAGLDDASSMGAGLGLAMLVGGGLQVTGQKDTGVSDEQKNWEKELAEGAEGDHVESEPVPETPEEAPQGEQKQVETGHPLGGAEVKIVDDVIDFQQQCQLMMFCHKIANAQFYPHGVQLIQQRREAKKAGNKEAYMQAIMQKKGMEESFNNQIIQQIFQKLGITQQQFQKTMQTYMSNPQTGQQIQMMMQQVAQQTFMNPEEEAKQIPLSKDKMRELVHHSMDIKVEGLAKVLGEGPPANQQEQQVKMLIMTAESEDNFFEKTGVELGWYSNQAHAQGMLEDPEFKKVIMDGQIRIQKVQQEVMDNHAKKEAAAAAGAAKPEDPKTTE